MEDNPNQLLKKKTLDRPVSFEDTPTPEYDDSVHERKISGAGKIALNSIPHSQSMDPKFNGRKLNSSLPSIAHSILKKSESSQLDEKKNKTALHGSKTSISFPFVARHKSKLVMPYEEDDEEEALENDPIINNESSEPEEQSKSDVHIRMNDDNQSNKSSVNSERRFVKSVITLMQKIYEMYHIAFTLSGHMLFVSTASILNVIHRWILSCQLSGNGCTLNALARGAYSSATPGYQVRQAIKLLGLVVPILISVTAYYFEWAELTSVVRNDACIPATYPDPGNLIPDIGNFLQGDTDLALIYSYGIPLEDGIVGGWSAWPLVNPYKLFSLQGNGVGYAISVECFQAYSAPNSYSGTKFELTSMARYLNSIYGTLRVYVPHGSMILDDLNIDDTNGFLQECAFNIQFFEAVTVNSFQSDEWEMVAVQSVLSVTVGNATVTLGKNQGRYVREFLQYTNTHYLVLQYDSTQTATCDYFASHGAGYLYGSSLLITLVQITVIVLCASMLLHIWWIYLLFGLDIGASLASHTLSSSVRFAHDIHKFALQIFGGSTSTLETFDEDLLRKIGETKVYFGTTSEFLNDENPHLQLGPKKHIITVRKLMQRKRGKVAHDNHAGDE
ncbi:hypothetical protein HDV06_004617 [Boothiomyces sp. JEL0866]|nr:hypothetical protein HDV06_004617 [Boothiomyces sp. JEL0866]